MFCHKTNVVFILFNYPVYVLRILKIVLCCVTYISRWLSWPKKLCRHYILVKLLKLIPNTFDLSTTFFLLIFTKMIFLATFFKFRLAVLTKKLKSICIHLWNLFFHSAIFTLVAPIRRSNSTRRLTHILLKYVLQHEKSGLQNKFQINIEVVYLAFCLFLINACLFGV